MKIHIDEKKEGIIAILAAFFVLFSAMINPLVSAIIAIGILSCIGIWKISNKQCGGEHKMDKRKIGEVLLILAMVLSVGGAIGYITGQLPKEQICGIGALALMFTVVGLGMKKAKQ